MKPIIVGTAGHIDHGKSALVRALTGIDPDRLEEEKRRGITIDLGFAHLEVAAPDGEHLRFGFVDVPGHERFVRNMLAGVGGIDLVVLVIAADEGIKPQTREHFDICRLLSLERGLTLLTKADLVDTETLDILRLEVEDFLRGSALATSPIIPVSVRTGIGLEDLKRELAACARKISPKDAGAITRLPLDRVFTMKGFGTVVTGTLIAGTIKKDEELELFPAGRRVRVRGVQVYGKAAERAVAGERTALNLAGVNKPELERGMVLTAPGQLGSSSRLDVKLSLLDSSPPVEDGSRIHFHAFSSEAIARVRLYQGREIAPGETTLAQLRLAAPLVLVPGDRFIVRRFSPVVTIGGGVVLDARPVEKMALASRMSFLRRLDGDSEAALAARIERRGTRGAMLGQLVEELGQAPSRVELALAPLLRANRVVRDGDFLMHRAACLRLAEELERLVSDFHLHNPLVGGISKESLREKARVSPPAFQTALAVAVEEGKLHLTAELIHAEGAGVKMRDDEAESRRIIEQAFQSAGLKVPALKDVLAGLKIDRARAQKIVTLLLREKALVKISDDLVFHRSALEALRNSVAAVKGQSPRIDVAGFKNLTGVSRKYAIPLLEYLDRERVTRRVGDERLIL
ncbi:MAG: selenocysteine-specific translation elongation factor [Acidobacteria bacterium]|nr:selenocysteine-specific translation elongation factor [Acidobacteriota bacterium]